MTRGRFRNERTRFLISFFSKSQFEKAQWILEIKPTPFVSGPQKWIHFWVASNTISNSQHNLNNRQSLKTSTFSKVKDLRNVTDWFIQLLYGENEDKERCSSFKVMISFIHPHVTYSRISISSHFICIKISG